MPPIYANVAAWPGATHIRSLSYLCPHGISPGIAELVTNPQDDEPEEEGELTIGDGTRTLILPGCRVIEKTSAISGNGRIWTMIIEDRRWRWRTGNHRAVYNQLDEAGKLVPWTIRSIEEILRLLLTSPEGGDAAGLGERGIQIVLPAGQDPGLPKSIGENLNDYLRPGNQLPPSAGNLACNWEAGITPAQALADFTDRLGMRVVYVPRTDGIAVVPLGYSQSAQIDLTIPMTTTSNGVRVPALPKRIVLKGQEVLHQMRILLTPVAKEFDGTYVDHHLASYAPKAAAGRRQITYLNSTGPAAKFHTLALSFSDGRTATFIENTLFDLQLAITGDVLVAEYLDVTTGGFGELILTGKLDGVSFGVSARMIGDVPSDHTEEEQFSSALYQSAVVASTAFDGCPPPLFPSVRPTDRLSKSEAQQLAASSVWRAFRITLIDPADYKNKKKPLRPPGAPEGFVSKRRHQYRMTPFKVLRIVPQGRNLDGTVADQGESFAGILPDFYNGVSTAQPAMIYGGYAQEIQRNRIVWKTATSSNSGNVPRSTRCYVNFSIDIDEQLIVFSDFVYARNGAGQYVDPCLVYEGGVVLLDADRSAAIRYEKTLDIPGGSGPEAVPLRNDVTVYRRAKYDANDNVLEVIDEDFGHGVKAADNHLAGFLRTLQRPQQAAHVFHGIQAFDPDGIVHFVRWSIGDAGCKTSVSLNSEISDVYPGYPARRFNEYLPPDKLAAMSNYADNFGGPEAAAQKLGTAGAAVARAIGGSAVRAILGGG